MFEPNKFDQAFKRAIKFEQIMDRLQKTTDQLNNLTSKFSKGFKFSSDQADRLLKRTQQLRKEITDLALKQANISKLEYSRQRGLENELKLTKKKREEIEKIQKQLAQTIKLEQTQFDASKQKKLIDNYKKSFSMSTRILSKEALMGNLSKELGRLIAGYNGNSNTPLGKSIAQKQDAMGQHNAELLSMQSKLNQLDAIRASIMTQQSDKIKELNDEMKKLNDAYKEQEQLEKLILALKQEELAQQKRERQFKFKDFLKNKIAPAAEGISQFGGMGLMLGALAIAIVGILALIKSLFGTFKESLKSTIDLGFDASQRMRLISDANRQTAQELSQGALITPSENIQARAALAERLGTLLIPDEAITRVAFLYRQIGLSVQDASTLLEYFVRINGQTAEVSAKQLVSIKAFALQNHLNVRSLMEDVNSGLADFAKSGHETAESMSRAAIGARQLGINLDSISGLADKMTGNFEDFLSSQASVGTYLPGFNLNRVFIASQFGTLEDVTRSLKASIDQYGSSVITSLPRSLKNEMASSLGIPFDNLVKIANGDLKIQDATKSTLEIAVRNGLNELQQAVVNPLDSINRGVFSIYTVIARWFGNSAEKGAIRQQDEIAAMKARGILKNGNISVQADDIRVSPSNASSGNFNINTFLGKTASTTVPSSAASQFSTSMNTSTDPSSPHAPPTKVEQKLDTLINLFKTGGIAVYMDRKKVSTSMFDKYGN